MFNAGDPIDKSQFVYFGISENLHYCINSDLQIDNTSKLQFNFDGLPLYQLSAQEFWPILCKIHDPANSYKPFVIAIHFGKGKPKNVKKFLSEFVDELNFFTQKWN